MSAGADQPGLVVTGSVGSREYMYMSRRTAAHPPGMRCDAARRTSRIGVARPRTIQHTSWAAFAVVLRSPSSRISAEMIATNAAALAVTDRHGLPAPRLLALGPQGRDAGVPATLESVVAGSSAWPAECSADLLRAAGAAIARVHTIALEPQPQLPVRPRPIAVDDLATERRLGRMATTDLLRRADEQVRAVPAPAQPAVFVHGDVGGAVRRSARPPAATRAWRPPPGWPTGSRGWRSGWSPARPR